MPMELRKRKTPPPPPPPRVKRTKSAAGEKAEKKEKAPAAKRVKDAVVSKGEEVVKAVETAVAPEPATASASASAAKKETKTKAPAKKSAAAEKKEAAAAEKKAAAEEKKAEKAAAAEEKKAAAAAAAAEKKEATAAAATAASSGQEEKKDEVPVEEKKADAKPAEEKKEIKTLKIGDTIPEELTGVKTEGGEETSLKKLLEKSDKGIIVFAYPAASTPGCTKQACHFRDTHTAFTTAGYSVFGLSGDSPKKNKAFAEKQKLGYSLLCDEDYSLHEAFGIKKTGPKKSTTDRSVFALNKEGKIVLLEKGTPDGTWEAAKKFAGI